MGQAQDSGYTGFSSNTAINSLCDLDCSQASALQTVNCDPLMGQELILVDGDTIIKMK